MINYPVGDFLIRIKNAYLAKKESVTAPYSKMNEKVAKILKAHSFIADFKTREDKERKHKFLEITLSYRGKVPALSDIKIISKPGRRIYSNVKNMPYPPARSGIVLVSTPKGVMTAKEAVKKEVGGEVIGYVW